MDPLLPTEIFALEVQPGEIVPVVDAPASVSTCYSYSSRITRDHHVILQLTRRTVPHHDGRH